MSEKRYSGNIISSTPVEPSGALENSAASGVWSLAEAFAYTKAGLWPTAGNAAPTNYAVFAGGATSTTYGINTIQRVAMSSGGAASDFGDLTVARSNLSGCSSSTVGLFGAGSNGTTGVNTIDQITFATLGNAVDFGDTTIAASGAAGLSNSTRGLWAGGLTGSIASGFTLHNTINYVTIASAGNATDFGDMVSIRYNVAGCGSPTRGIISGGQEGVVGNGNQVNTIEYVTFASTGNTTDFGDLSFITLQHASTSSNTRGLMAGGYSSFITNSIDYITIASTGNGTDFGDLLEALQRIRATSNNTKAVFAGGDTGGSFKRNTISYVTIDTTGNATDFGDLLGGNTEMGAVSGSHGGLS